ncbi:MAG: transcription elongation factor GreA [Clostridia bacterium]|nr:transcription elongation factor GreA [Clostridia bacterium]
METRYVTVVGEKKLKDELAELMSKRSDIARQIKEAREFGDLKENAEYAAAREAQNNLEIRVKEVEALLQNLTIFSYKTADTSAVNLGTSVLVENMATKKQETYVITGFMEFDIEKNYISNESPKGKALLGKKVGEVAIIKTPASQISLKILKINRAE